MKSTETYTCDQCGADLTLTGNSEGYRIVVGSQSIPGREGAVTDWHVPNPLPRNHHFCDLECLRANPLITGASA